MGKPAARMGDMTAHGGAIVAGCPTVLIGGKPAARVNDMHVCPQWRGDTPHVGGPVTMGSAMVLIGGAQAARVGDLLVCNAPPDNIAIGCPNVLIGDGGGGGGGGGGSSAAVDARASAATAMQDNKESSTREPHWVEFEFVDSAGRPVSGVPYRFTGPDGEQSEGVLRLDGRVRRDGLPEGECKVELFGLRNARWSKEKANVGEKVKMSVEVDGYEDGSPADFTIYERDIRGAERIVGNVERTVHGGKAEGVWEHVHRQDEDGAGQSVHSSYASREFYFEVSVRESCMSSGLLSWHDTYELTLIDEEDQPLTSERVIVTLSTGESREVRSDASGKIRLTRAPADRWKLTLPEREHLSEED